MFYIELRGYGFIVNSPRLSLRVAPSVGRPTPCTDKKENKIFLIYKVIQSGAIAKSYMRKGFLIYEESANIYEEAVSHI
jgi:hypothetical protein